MAHRQDIAEEKERDGVAKGRVERSGQQYAALALRGHGGEARVLLITSRDTGRWVLPKGWAETGLTGPELAAKEAFEEAGIRGAVAEKPAGAYGYAKRLPGERPLRCTVAVFPMRVERELKDWPERRQRRRQWFSLPRAAALVREPELTALLLRLAASS